MPIYKPSELRQFLNELGISPKKVLSQNFLIDGNIIRKIVEAADVQPGDVVLEIGPGPGSLSEALLEKGAHVVAVELDDTLAQALKRLDTDDHRLHVYCEDIMQFPIVETLEKLLPAGKKAKVIANLPYHLTTPILAFLIPLNGLFSSLTVMVQDEVARRFTALPSTPEYSSFTVFLNFFTKPRYSFTVSKRCFFPEPSVQSAVVSLELKPPPQIADPDNFFKMTRTAFSQRRKMMRASLRELYAPEAVMAALEAIGKDPQSRPETLSLEEWLRLFEVLSR
ncbi:MAG: ribosomal RNA small subunit methyltransferase A [Parachlamydiaceae bacterium]|nr:ribosomal RNA small subunit methyltransferase A [Parachlamydiaceae bacterium]